MKNKIKWMCELSQGMIDQNGKTHLYVLSLSIAKNVKKWVANKIPIIENLTNGAFFIECCFLIWPHAAICNRAKICYLEFW